MSRRFNYAISAALFLCATLFSSCNCKGTAKKDDNSGGAAGQIPDSLLWNGYMKIEPIEIEDNVMKLIHEDWMLITSGTESDFNTMTASWGALGVLWQKPVAFSMVRNTRYTYQFMKKNDTYTLSFFDERYREKLVHLGTHSGRDGDKVKKSGLTPMVTPTGSMSFREARIVIECRKLYEDKLDPKSIFDDKIMEDYLKTPKEFHELFIGEIVNVWVREKPVL